MAEEGITRVSCGAFCRIRIDGKYLLLLNHNRRSKGIYQLTPIGGAIMIDDWRYLVHLDVRPTDPASHDLRFYLPLAQMDEFRHWFYSRQNRELVPFRELREELVDETGILFDLKRSDVTMQFVHIVEDLKQTQRRGFTGRPTQYFFEIFDVDFRAPDVILRLKTVPQSKGLVLVDESQIRNEQSLTLRVDGQERMVGVGANYLFAAGHPRPD
jgi:hypothetical protein